ncbi:MAG: RsmD family RNA methyltransferase [Candidatus Hecatellaceae archaeon]
MERLTKWGLPRSLFQGPAYQAAHGRLSVEADVEKISLRMQVYQATGPHRTVLDLFAGKGYLAWLYAKHGCEKLICIEKDPAYFQALTRNLAEFSRKVSLHNMDNLRWLDECLEAEEPITYVDFDAFGSPAVQIQRFFAKYPVRGAIAVSLTDGIIMNFRRLSNADLRRLYLQDFYVDPNLEPGKPKSIQNLGEYWAEIQKGLISILAMRFGFQAFPLYFKVNRRRTAIYSAYLVLPKILGEVDFKRYVGLRVMKSGSAIPRQRSLKNTG